MRAVQHVEEHEATIHPKQDEERKNMFLSPGFHISKKFYINYNKQLYETVPVLIYSQIQLLEQNRQQT